jgi:hypothetical protein
LTAAPPMMARMTTRTTRTHNNAITFPLSYLPADCSAADSPFRQLRNAERERKLD